MSKNTEAKKLNVSAFVTIQIPEDFYNFRDSFFKNVDENDKKLNIVSRKVDVLIEAHGQVREFSIDEFIRKLGFNVPSPIQKA